MDLNQLVTLHRTYKSFGRFREIVRVLSRHGLTQFFQTSPLRKFLPFRERIRRWTREEDGAVPVPRRIRMAMEELGPTFVKLGQMLSMRPDLVPPDFIREFQYLQDSVAPLSYETIRPLLRAELGTDPSELFGSFVEKPIASASIAQVHEAVLKTGEKVVVKFQRPDIDRIVHTDLGILELLAELLVRYFPTLDVFNPVGIVQEFGRTMRRELDFRMEANNMEVIRAHFTEFKGVRIPALYREWGGQRVIVMEKIEGVKVTDVDGIRKMGHDPVKLARLGADIIIKQVLKDGVFHGDLHAGNILITPRGEVALLDFGVLGRMDKALVRSIATIFAALTQQEFGLIAEEILDLCESKQYIDAVQFERDVRNAVLPYFGLMLSQVNVGLVLLEVFGLAFKYRLRVPQDLFLLARSLVTIESIGRTLDPAFDVLEVGSTYTNDLVREQLDPDALKKEALVLGRSYLKLATRLPYQLKALSAQAVTSGVKLDLRDGDRAWSVRHRGRAMDRLSLSVLMSALLVGSALIFVAEKGPMFHSVPILAVLGAAGAGGLGLFLLLGFLRRSS